MFERRREPRVPSNIIVEVWGRDESGEPFAQSVKARNISVAGALLEGVDHDVRSGDVIGISHEGRQARFRVVWAMDFGIPPRKRVAVHKVEGQECPWPQELHASTLE
jgi:hypothetical protein